jgi:transposase
MPYCIGETFQIFLNQFSEQNKKKYKIIVLDNGAFHKAKKLEIPDNIVLLFLPPYSPELNPAEKMWHHIKRKFTNKHFTNLKVISLFFTETINLLTPDKIKSICSFEYISLGDF